MDDGGQSSDKTARLTPHFSRGDKPTEFEHCLEDHKSIQASLIHRRLHSRRGDGREKVRISRKKPSSQYNSSTAIDYRIDFELTGMFQHLQVTTTLLKIGWISVVLPISVVEQIPEVAGNEATYKFDKGLAPLYSSILTAIKTLFLTKLFWLFPSHRLEVV